MYLSNKLEIYCTGLASPVFRKMFTADFLEKISTKVHLPGKNYKEILTMLKVIYPNFIVNLEGKHWKKINNFFIVWLF